MSEHKEWHEGDQELLEEDELQIEEPPMYRVLLLNDDYTPMDFVVSILEQIFGKSHEEAVALMLDVHHKGSAVCGCYTAEIAKTKVAQVQIIAEKRKYPLQCILEKV